MELHRNYVFDFLLSSQLKLNMKYWMSSSLIFYCHMTQIDVVTVKSQVISLEKIENITEKRFTKHILHIIMILFQISIIPSY